jgi:hypothetical protein
VIFHFLDRIAFEKKYLIKGKKPLVGPQIEKQRENFWTNPRRNLFNCFKKEKSWCEKFDFIRENGSSCHKFEFFLTNII